MLRHLSRFLHDFGYRVRQAADSSQCLAAISAAPCDLLLVDESLAAEDGVALVRKLAPKSAQRELVDLGSWARRVVIGLLRTEAEALIENVSAETSPSTERHASPKTTWHSK